MREMVYIYVCVCVFVCVCVRVCVCVCACVCVLPQLLTALRQHAFLLLLQLLGTLSRLHGRLEHALAGAHAHATRGAARAPVRPGRQHAGDGVCRHQPHTHTHR